MTVITLVIGVVAAMALAVPLPAPAAGIEPAESRFAQLIAVERAHAGLASYRVASDLADVARAHAEVMAAGGRLYHNPSLREQVQDWEVVGENVGRGEAVEEIHQALMDSSTHRRQIVSTRFVEVGVGVVRRDGLIWVSQVFRLPMAPAPATTALPSRAPAATGAPASVRAPATSPAPTGPVPPVAAPDVENAPAPSPPVDPLAGHRGIPDAGGTLRQVPTEVAVAAGMLLMAVSGLTSQVGGGAEPARRRRDRGLPAGRRPLGAWSPARAEVLTVESHRSRLAHDGPTEQPALGLVEQVLPGTVE